MAPLSAFRKILSDQVARGRHSGGSFPLTERSQVVIETLSFHAILSGPEHKACLVQKAGCPACLENSGLSFFLGSSLWAETPQGLGAPPHPHHGSGKGPPIPSFIPHETYMFQMCLLKDIRCLLPECNLSCCTLGWRAGVRVCIWRLWSAPRCACGQLTGLSQLCPQDTELEPLCVFPYEGT